METWGERIQRRRIEVGISVTDLARACGIKSPSVHDWENGKTKKIEGDNLLAAAQALRVTPDWILRGHGPRERGAAPAASASVPALRPDQRALLDLYEAMSPAQKDAFAQVGHALAQPKLKRGKSRSG